MKIKNNIDVKKLNAIKSEKANWDDEAIERPVYKIKLSELHYNEENGRIATWISMYTSEKGNKPLSSLSRDEFNDVISEFVLKANSKDSFDRLKNDLRKKTQLTPGVILTDGTIVSGNRRFTALRKLYEEDGDEKFNSFLCFVIDTPTNRDEREFVKLIETKTQFGVVQNEDYNAIDRLVTIYRYLIADSTKLWSVKEYAKKIGIKEAEAENLVDRATIMVDYLSFIGKPLQFHIARMQKIDGPIVEIARLYKKLKNGQLAEWNRIKPLLYSEMNKENGDISREVRRVKNIYVKSPTEYNALLEDWVDQQEKIEAQQMKETGKVSKRIARIHEDRQPKRIAVIDQTKIKETLAKVQQNEAREKPIKKAESSLSSLNEIDLEIVENMNQSDKNKLLKRLELLENKISEIKRKLK